MILIAVTVMLIIIIVIVMIIVVVIIIIIITIVIVISIDMTSRLVSVSGRGVLGFRVWVLVEGVRQHCLGVIGAGE